jgi:HK97 gp10 family phage protein
MTAKFTIDGIKVDNFCKELKSEAFVAALKAAAVPIMAAYRQEVTSNVLPGNKNFVKIVAAIESKVQTLADGSGVYLIVGTAREGGQRIAPQALFGEFGTAKRETRGKGPKLFSKQNRGKMPARRWLQNALTKSTQDARSAMMKALSEYVRRRT